MINHHEELARFGNFALISLGLSVIVSIRLWRFGLKMLEIKFWSNQEIRLTRSVGDREADGM